MAGCKHRRTVALAVAAALVASCSHARSVNNDDPSVVRQQALAILAKRPMLPVAHVVAPMCPPGSELDSGNDCFLEPEQRPHEALYAANMVVVEMLVFMDVCNKHRDEIAAAIVRDPRFVDTLLRATVHAHDCFLYPDGRESCARDLAVPEVDAQIENMFAKTLAAAIRGDSYSQTRSAILTAPGALSDFDKLYDSDLRAYQEQVPDLDAQIVIRLLGAAKATQGSGSG